MTRTGGTPARVSAEKINLLLSIRGLHHGGAERVVASLCNEIDRDRFTFAVCCELALGAVAEELRDLGIELIGLREIDPDAGKYSRFRVLNKLCRDRNIHVIHTHDTASLADAAQSRLIGSRSKIVHTFHFGNYPNLKFRYLMMEGIFSRLAHKLVAVGHEQAKRIQSSLRLQSSDLATLYNGVENIVPDEENGAQFDYRVGEDGPVVIGSISTLTTQKGLPILLEAAKILSDMRKAYVLLVVGDGELRTDLESKAKALGVEDSVRFLGWVPNAAGRILPKIDIFCQSSLWEANSIVLLEAMSAGLPIVTTNVGESRHVIDDGDNGRVVEPGDANSLALALADLIDNADRRRSIGKKANAKFKANYTLENMVTGYESIYEDLLVEGKDN